MSAAQQDALVIKSIEYEYQEQAPRIGLSPPFLIFPPARTVSGIGKDPHFSLFGDLYWIGCDKSCSTLIGRHKLGAVNKHVYQPLTKLCCVHL